LGTGGTLKDLLAWGQNFAAQRYGDVYGRRAQEYGMNRSNAADTYRTNYQTQYVDPYENAFRASMAEFEPKMVGYTTQAAAGQRADENAWNRAWQRFQFDWDKFRDQRDSTWNKSFQYATA
jgi:hypothetical protein